MKQKKVTQGTPEVVYPPAGFNPELLDPTAKPCQDFYQYACGGWLAKTQIPADQPMWSRSFSEINENNEKLLRDILVQFANRKTHPLPDALKSNPYGNKMGDFYAACMDKSLAENGSLGDLKAQLAKVDELSGLKALPPLLAELHLDGVGGFFNFSSEQDKKNPNLMVGAADQGGLSLPDRDYYLSKNKKMAQIRAMYRDHIVRTYELLGVPLDQARKNAATVLKVETSLARPELSKVERRNPKKIYHRLERAGLEKLVPDFNWNSYFAGLGIPHVKAIDVMTPHFFAQLSRILKTLPTNEMKTYLKWHLIETAIPALPERFVQERFRFVSTALSGQKKLPARWKRCVRATDAYMGFALGRAFVDTHYGKSGKKISEKMLKSIEEQMGITLNTIKWMDAPTRKEALNKLAHVYNKIGYPDKWRSYDGLQVTRTSYLKNRFAGDAFDSHYWLNKIGKPVDRSEWYMTPPTVNAYYDPSMNEMVFPAGILQPPFFDTSSHEYGNYGGIGMVMGHELTHGFDDEGRQFDAQGRLRDWWTPKVAKAFRQRAQCMVHQFSQYKVQGMPLNGKLTLGENIADQGGIKDSFEAWKKQAGDRVSEKDASGFTREQKFFLSFAQTWCTKIQPQYARLRVTVDPHSPSRYRVDGPLSNFPEFAKAFSCSAGTPMVRAKSCAIW